MRYRVKSVAGVETYLDLLRSRREGYDIRITSVTDRSVKETDEFISTHLFEACIRTGYLVPCEVESATGASA